MVRQETVTLERQDHRLASQAQNLLGIAASVSNVRVTGLAEKPIIGAKVFWYVICWDAPQRWELMSEHILEHNRPAMGVWKDLHAILPQAVPSDVPKAEMPDCPCSTCFVQLKVRPERNVFRLEQWNNDRPCVDLEVLACEVDYIDGIPHGELIAPRVGE